MVRASSYLGSLAVLAASAVGKEIQPNEAIAAELYDSGIVHEQMMASKKVRSPSSSPWSVRPTDTSFHRPNGLARERRVPTTARSTPSWDTLPASTDGPRPLLVTG